MRKPLVLLLITVCGCVGVDVIDDPVVGEKIVVSSQQIALTVDQRTPIEATYFDAYGIEQNVEFIWTSSVPTVAVVNSNGQIVASNSGQTIIQPSYKNFYGPLINVVVVNDASQIALVEISAIKTSLSPGETTLVNAVAKNIDGTVIQGKTIEWFSENNAILSVTAAGEVAALQKGVAGIHAKSEGVKSSSITFTVGFTREGAFVKAGGYEAQGTALLKQENGTLILELGPDFKTSFALGTFIYLANSTNGQNVRASGFEVGQITANGPHTFNISALNPTIDLFDYRYIIILCKPASVTFGYADLN